MVAFYEAGSRTYLVAYTRSNCSAHFQSFVGLIMFLVLGKPLSLLLLSLQNWLAGLSGSSAIILGAVLGLMMCFDLGGPVNKAVYLFATAGLSTNEPAALHIMAAVMVAGMLPRLHFL
ncbi:hypothetical protein CIP107550_01392 [Corynebacterium diphtheriae]|nr:hypothetical protein CIP107550_01392 [Corynebacterium diphtheriae]